MEPQSAGSHRTGQRLAPALRVAVVLDSFLQPAWARKLLGDLRESGFAEVAVAVKRDAAPHARGPLLHDLYLRLDDRLFPERPDAFEEGDVRDLLPVREAGPSALAGEDLDVVVVLGGRPSEWAFAARHGAWSVREAAPGGALPGLLEVLEAAPSTEALVLAWPPGGAPQVVASSHGPTDHVSVRRNRNALLWKGGALLFRALRDLARFGPPAAAPAPPPRRRPGNLATAGLLVRLALRYLRGKALHLLAREQWCVAYRFGDGTKDDGLDGLAELTPPKDRFWADPFPVSTPDGRFFVFFEELFYRDWKGRILAVELAPGKPPGEPVVALERPYHLSYPQVFSWRGQHYMLPESSANRTVTLFRCLSFPDKWVEEKDLLVDVDAVDATLAEIDGRWWMFVNVALPGAGNRDELHLYHAPSPLGPWTAHAGNPVKSDCRSARPAGAPFRRGGELLRPAQNCSGTYGASVVLHRIEEITPESYRETPVREIAAGSLASRIHTFNRQGGLLCVDLLRRRRRFP